MAKKTKRLLKAIKEFLSEDKRCQRREMDNIKDLLKKLKKHQHDLEDKRDDCKDSDDKRELNKDIQIVRAQRKKALKVLKNMRD